MLSRKLNLNYRGLLLFSDFLILILSQIFVFLIVSVNQSIVSPSTIFLIPLFSCVVFYASKLGIVFLLGNARYASFEDIIINFFGLIIVYLCLITLNSIYNIWQYQIISFFSSFLLSWVGLVSTRLYHREKNYLMHRFGSRFGKRTIVYGAGTLGNLITKQINNSEKSGLNLLGFVDDNPKLMGYRINKMKVLGNFGKISNLHSKIKIELLLLAIKDLNRLQIEKITSKCEELNIEIRIVPSLNLILNNNIKYEEMKTINIADILGRNSRITNNQKISELIQNKKVLVTGAGGSIGSELVRQISSYSPKMVGCLDRDESALHALELSLFGSGLLLGDNMILADLRDSEAIENVVREFKPDIVFHAAALKHVVMLEKYPAEALKTNIMGTEKLVGSCLENHVKLFINISTDKAAKPTSVLGNSKLSAEKIVSSANQKASENEKYLSVRFGNVLGSRGSFLDTFKYQIENNYPITITDKNVKRFFMTVEEAVFLVLQSAAIGPKGSILYLDMGEPVKIEDVARKLIIQSGKNIEIQYSGLRQGEKLDEVLFDSDTEISLLLEPGIYQIIEKNI